MVLRVPHYYKDFSCIGSECRDNCCIGGWEIEIDEETALSYFSLEGPFGDRLRAAIEHTDSYCFKLENGRCPFLDQQNLCEIYQTLGPDRMGVVCDQFPRFTEYYGNIKETGIGLACEEAERIIFSNPESFHLVTIDCEEAPITDSEYDQRLGDALFILRDHLLVWIEHTGYDLFEKLSAMIHIGDQLQQLINNNDYTAIEKYCNNIDMNTILAKQHKPGAATDSVIPDEQQASIEERIARILYAYLELEALNEDWSHALDHVLKRLHPKRDSRPSHTGTSDSYETVSAAFMESMKTRIYEYQHLIQYYLFRYLMKAAYDHDLFGKIQLICANFLVIRDMDITRWLDGGHHFSFQDRIDTVHIFSREVEYSEENLWTLSEEFIFDEIFKAEPMAGLMDALHSTQKTI